jgi:hypothetical protein
VRNRGDAIPVTIPDDRRVYLVRGGDVQSFPVPGQGRQIGPAVAFEGRVYVNDDAKHSVLVFDYRGTQVQEIDVPDANGPLELEVREQHLFINAPNSASARVVDSKHKVLPVNKYPQDVLGSEKPAVSTLLNVPAPTNTGPARPQQNDNAVPRGTKKAPPGPPGAVTATAGNKSARVTWASARSNGSAISAYVVEGGGTSRRVSGRAHSAVIDGLDNGTEYSFTVHAVNEKGAGPKAESNKVTPTAEVPDPPTSVTAATDKEGGVTVTWPQADGQGTQIASYTATADDGRGGTRPFTSDTTRLVIPAGELDLGTAYTFKVVATSDRGAASAPSAASNPVTPYTRPGAPETVTASAAGPGTVKVTWRDAPENGSPITAWVVRPSIGQERTLTDPAARETTFTGLPDGRQVVVSVHAVNEAGPGEAKEDRASTPKKPVVTITGRGAGTTSITVDFSIDDGNSPLRECTLQVNGAGNASGCGGSLTVGGLRPGTDYGFTLTARNDVGSDAQPGTVRTSSVFGVVTCINGTTGDQATYCNTGIRSFTNSSQTRSGKAQLNYNGDRLEAICYKRSIGEDGQPDEIYGFIYNHHKRSIWWIQRPGGTYIPYAWLNFEGYGPTEPANPADAGVPAC